MTAELAAVAPDVLAAAERALAQFAIALREGYAPAIAALRTTSASCVLVPDNDMGGHGGALQPVARPGVRAVARCRWPGVPPPPVGEETPQALIYPARHRKAGQG